jgi:CheY-like chemotaxis protein
MTLPSTPTGAKFRILVVEDDAEVARLMLLNLSRAGLDCRYAPDGPTALTAFKEAEPHLVLLDLMLPGFDGRAVCMQIRQESTIPIIVMTAMSGEEPQLQCFKLGADDYVTKPFNPKLLVARVIAHLRRVYAYDIEAESEEEQSPPPMPRPTVPAGFARCEGCGYSGPQTAFELKGGAGVRSMACPRCRSKEHIVMSIG